MVIGSDASVTIPAMFSSERLFEVADSAVLLLDVEDRLVFGFDVICI